MLKILASWKKILAKVSPANGAKGRELVRALRRRGVYLLLLALIFSGSYYLVTNDAVFKKPTVETFTTTGKVALSQEAPSPKELPMGSATVPPELQEQTGVHAAPATTAEGKRTEDLPHLVLPVTGKLTKGYGFSYAPAFGDYRFHSGVDIEVPAGSEVKAAAAGVVRQVEYSDAWRYRLIIDLDNGYQLVYAHLNSIKVAKGDKLTAGTVLGQVGEPGTAEAGTPPHLHLELLKNGSAIDPVSALR